MVSGSLNQSTNALDKAIERMTTGYRINKASDDAVGYAVAKNMDVKLSSYGIAKDNTQMGLSYVDTATESLDNITSQLQRIRDLTEQASNGTYSQEQRSSMQKEIDQRTAEINRVLKSTTYNGKKVFDYSTGAAASIQSSITPLSAADATSAGYTLINSSEDLISAISTNSSGKYILMNDVSLTSFLGDFSGELNGNGHTINIGGDSAIFNVLSNVTVKNLNINAAISSSNEYIAALANTLKPDGGTTTISNVAVVGSIDVNYAKSEIGAGDQNFIGSLISYSDADYSYPNLVINNSTSNVDINVSLGTKSTYVGGLLGVDSEAGLLVSGSSYTGNINITSSAPRTNAIYAGGITALLNLGSGGASTITNSYTSGAINIDTVGGGDFVGGIVGAMQSGTTVSNCVSYMSSIINNPNATDESTVSRSGGIAGVMWGGTIKNCYTNIANITSSVILGQHRSGGIVGEISTSGGSVLDSYSDSIADGTLDVNNIYGVQYSGSISYSGSYTKDDIKNIVPKYQDSIGSSIYVKVGIDSGANSLIKASTGLSLSFYSNVSSSTTASNSLDSIDSALAKIIAKQADLGASSNRLESANNQIDVAIDNLTSSLSTIKDADIAKESSAYIKAQILQQAAATLLVTTNQSPSIALQLI